MPAPTLSRRSSAKPAKFCEQVLTPLNRSGDKEGCKRNADGSVTTPKGFKDAYKQLVEGGWIGISAPAEFGGQGLPVDPDRDRQRIPRLVQSRLLDVSRPGAGRGRGDPRARLRRAEEEIPAEDDHRRMGRHHESHRAALRHRSRPVAHQGGEAAGRQLQDHRHQDFHFRRRAGSDREHHPSRARAHRRRAGGHQGHFALHRAESAGEGRRLARRQERRRLRLDRREDGHPRQFHLRDELRQCHRLADRHREPRAQCHVHDDERGAAWCCRAGAGVVRSRLPERGDLFEGAVAGPRAHRREISRQAGRSDHRASGCAPHVDDHPRLQRGGARAGDLDRAQRRHLASLRRRKGAQGRRRPDGSAHAGAERRADRSWLCQCGDGAADVRRPRLHFRVGHGAIRARCAHPDDL